MKRLTFILITLIIFSLKGFPQENKIIDSLKNALALSSADTSRAIIMVELSANYRFSKPDSGMVYGKRAFDFSNQIGYERGISLALGYQSLNHAWLGDFPAALKNAFEGLEISERTQDDSGKGLQLNVIGMVYFELGEYQTAEIYFRRQKEINNDSQIRKALERQAYALTDLGEVLIYQGKLDSASYYQHSAIDAFKRAGRIVDPLCFSRLGDIEIRKHNIPKAKAYYHEGLQLSVINSQQRAISEICVKMARLYKNEGTLDSAIFYAKKGIAVASSINQKRNMLAAAKLLAEIYEPIDTGLALSYYKQADSIRNGMFGAGNIQAIQALITKEEERKSELKLAEESFNNRLRMNALMGSTFTLAVIAFFLVRNNRQNKKAKKKIESAYDQLKSTQSQLIQSEKMASLGELTAGIAHEIQNPLNFVNNFSEVNTELIRDLKSEIRKGNIEEVNAIAKDIESNEGKIVHHGKRADAIVKGMLQHSRASSGQKEPTDINALCDEYLRLSYHGLRAKDKSFNAKFETDFDSSLPKLNVVPQDIGRVVLNLINNGFYAVSERLRQAQPDNNNVTLSLSKGDIHYEPTVTVSTKKVGDKVEIKVSDNGNGISDAIKEKIFQPFFTTKPTGQGTGLGLSLSYDIVKAHRGDLNVESKEGEGSEFVIQLPIV